MKKILDVIDTIIYYLILIPLAIITITVVYKGIKYPDRIPDVFGYKMFIVLDSNMHKEVKYGDLLFTKMKNAEELEKKDIIAVRTNREKVILQDVIEVNKKTNDEYEIVINDDELPTITQDKVEGEVINRIPKIGAFLFFIQNPLTLLIIALVIIAIGTVQYLIARKLDLRDMKKLEELAEKEKEKLEEENKKENKEKITK